MEATVPFISSQEIPAGATIMLWWRGTGLKSERPSRVNNVPIVLQLHMRGSCRYSTHGRVIRNIASTTAPAGLTTQRCSREGHIDMNLEFWQFIFFLIELSHGWTCASVNCVIASHKVSIINNYSCSPNSLACEAEWAIDSENMRARGIIILLLVKPN